ncbi:DUF4179 domain-containing protein [Anaerocolumna sp. AGMB13020]|uniref:DUF4179 domain-containing protein n=1 Tax=Anaerocolumna sp. AGMB13020 TaxID=3081750 RepID=UPI0029536615|nr:DUF4179 domain-containing protein [Anaerocolumna sp. AGMB13020]WOO39110.1 DUF4179 domain-containing protein [Anaerocolumna sp. AGMB13020]
MPKETEHFHQKICEVIQSLPEDGSYHRLTSRRLIPVFALAIFLLSSVTVFAAIKWNDRAVDHFNADEKMQHNLSEEGYSRQDIQSVMDNSITVTLKQTIQDENMIYLLFNITTDNIELSENNLLSYDMKVNDSSDFYTSISSGFVDKFTEPKVSNSREYEIWIQKDTSYNFSDAILNCNFNALQETTDKGGAVVDLARGQWNFNINLKVKDSITINLNKNVSIDGCNVLVRSLKISPLSYTLICSGQDVRELQRLNNIDLNELDITYPLIISGIKYEAGTIIPQIAGLMSEGFADESGDYIAIGKFSDAIDIEQIQSILFGEKKNELIIK